jgi:peptidoglycan hydrolase-like protein with peptidoglycan-binding domain
MTVSGSSVLVSGSGNGPYTASYTITGNEILPMPIVINFSNPAGSASSAYFWIGSTAAVPTTSAAVSSSAGNSSLSNYTFTQYLYNGSSGPQVTALQQRLTDDGLYNGPIIGNYGPLTETAVKAYQKKHDINPLGVVGPATRALLNEGI